MLLRTAFGSLIVAALVFTASLDAQETTAPTLKPRVLAPGVLTTIAPNIEASETALGPRRMVELTDGPNAQELNEWNSTYTPKSAHLMPMVDAVTFYHTVWGLEFSFKPLRMIEVDLPQADGRMKRELVWYMVYRITNTGTHITPVQSKDANGNLDVKMVSTGTPPSVRFFPIASFETHDTKQRVMDKIMPLAVPKIQRREDPAIPLHNSVQISQRPIPLSTADAPKSIWGVLTWTGIDREVDFFSIYINGLTNAYKSVDPPGAFKPGDPPRTGRKYQFKTLQLNFWRPGDELDPDEEEIHYGLPLVKTEKQEQGILKLYGLEKRVDYLWIYR